jgi:hypothetical protein
MRFDLHKVQPLIGGPYRRSCEENLARMAWASRREQLAQAADKVQQLFDHHLLRPVDRRDARKVLATGTPEAIYCEQLRLEDLIAQRQAATPRLLRAPLYPALAA